jgi:hypothetical protein
MRFNRRVAAVDESLRRCFRNFDAVDLDEIVRCVELFDVLREGVEWAKLAANFG